MKQLVFTSLLAISFSALADLSPQKFEATYERYLQSARINCELPNLKEVSNKFTQTKSIRTQYSLNDLSLVISISKEGDELIPKLSTNQGDIKIERKGDRLLGFKYKTLSIAEKNIVDENGLRNIKCKLDLGYDVPTHVSGSQKLHINVHPNPRYDKEGHTIKVAEKYLADTTYQQLVLLDIRDQRFSLSVEDFIENTAIELGKGTFKIPTLNIPKQTPVVVAPAGHMRFIIESNDLDVVYTGGNINYCILNNSKNIIKNFLQYSSGGILNIEFDLDGIVAQNKTVITGGFFKGWFTAPRFTDGTGRYVGIFAKQVFKEQPEFSAKYHTKVKEIILEQTLISNQTSYKKLVFNYKMGDIQYRDTLLGPGEGEYEINYEYINF